MSALPGIPGGIPGLTPTTLVTRCSDIKMSISKTPKINSKYHKVSVLKGLAVSCNKMFRHPRCEYYENDAATNDAEGVCGVGAENIHLGNLVTWSFISLTLKGEISNDI